MWLEWVLERMGEENYEAKMRSKTILSKSFTVKGRKKKKKRTVAEKGGRVKKEAF